MIDLAIVVELFVSHVSDLDVVGDLGAALHRNGLLALDYIALHVGGRLRTGSYLWLFHSYDIFWTFLVGVGLGSRD